MLNHKYHFNLTNLKYSILNIQYQLLISPVDINNIEGESWIVWTKRENVFLLDEHFFTKYSLNALFKECCGEHILSGFRVNRFPDKIWKSRSKEGKVNSI